MSNSTSNHALLVPARFLITVGHLLAVSLVTGSLNDNIRASIDPHFSGQNMAFQESYPYPNPPAPGEPYYQQHHALLSSTTAALVTAYLCLVVDIIGLVTGVTIFSARINAFQSFVHFWGSVFTCWFVLYAMKAESLWSIVGWTNIPTCLVELINMSFLYSNRKRVTNDADAAGSQTHEA